MKHSLQLPLAVQLDDHANFSSFYPAGNQTLLSQLISSAQGQGERFYYLWGVAGSGCSHLLHAACRQAGDLQQTSTYISFKQHVDLTPEIFDGLETLSLVCIDDIEQIAGQSNWEVALFHFYNRCRDANTRLIVASHCPPRQLSIELPDLASRLSWGVVYQVHELADDDKLAALQLRAKRRGLELSNDVGQYLLTHCNRNTNNLFMILDKLDHASLAQQRRLTIPFIKSVLEL